MSARPPSRDASKKARENGFFKDMEDDPPNSDDGDWIANVPGRPAPYTTTWLTVYGKRTSAPQGSGFAFSVNCEEGGDGAIEMDGQYSELNGKSTPDGRLQKPPVCHIIPWALLSLAMSDFETKNQKIFTEEFKRYVCWGDNSNLRTGHNGCNAGGQKVTVQNATALQIQTAKHFVEKCIIAQKGNVYK